MNRRPLTVHRARENNLKEISLSLPHDQFGVITGLSGSGKSSLAFGTIYAEGQRRYIETFSPYTRQFFDKIKKPDVDLIENVRPALAIQQRVRILSSRSTVGSLTDINDYLKILWTNIARAVCPRCETPLKNWSATNLSTHLITTCALQPHRAYLICTEVPLRGDIASKRNELDRLSVLGYSRFLHPRTGAILRGEELKLTEHDESLIVVFDRIKGRNVSPQRVHESVEQAYTLGSGRCIVVTPSRARPFRTVHNTDAQANLLPPPFNRTEYAAQFVCPSNEVKLQRPRPALFSFNHPTGACDECKGFGSVLTVDLQKCVPDPSRSLADGAIQCWAGDAENEFRDLMKFCKKRGISVDIPWRELSESQRDAIITTRSKDYWGILPWFEWLETKTYKMHVRVFLSRYRTQSPCPRCHGTRLVADALAYRVRGKTIADLWQMPVEDLLTWLRDVEAELVAAQKLPRQIREVFTSLVTRLRYLCDLGLDYLTLDRQARTLSGGETQRVNLVAALGSELVSTHFILDEPSVGLHPRDTDRLIHAVRDLHARGNSVLAVEHDIDFIRSADHILELGPLAGEQGGDVVFCGDAKDWNGLSLEEVPPLEYPSKSVSADHETLKVRGASQRNLLSLDVDIPLNHFVCFTGVSGSGKSTLASEIIQKGFQHRAVGIVDDFVLEGGESLEQALLVDQSPLAKSPRANIATYSGIWNYVRDLLAGTEDAKTRALSRSSFSFNVNAGRCPACDGAGFVREDMQFLSDVYIPCEICLGKRFQHTVLEVQYKGKNVHELLETSVEACREIFSNVPQIVSACDTLRDLGLSHLRLGHPLSELSGGEAQRLKLVPFIQKSGKGRSLLIFDEPTTGLHVKDVYRLVDLFRLLRDRGHTVLCVEHNLTLISLCDWIIDLGPEGGRHGGRVVATGTPELVKTSNSHTGRHLRRYLEGTYEHTNRGATQERGDGSALHISGARVHNLKNIDVAIPLHKIVSLIGVSGSGKSSIAKDIIYAEGQRRYLDCLSPYARQFIKSLERPDIDSITQIMPTVCVYQHTFQPTALSTVGTMSEVYNFLRLLYSKTGTQYCIDHPDQPISASPPDEIARSIKELDTKLVRILAPVVKRRKGTHREVFARALASHIDEVRVDGVFGKPSSFDEGLAKSKVHSIEYVVAKCNPRLVDRGMLEDAVKQALVLGGGELIVHTGDTEQIFSSERACHICRKGYFKPDPEDLSFSSTRGRCSKCGGTGKSRSGVCPECRGTRLSALGRNVRINGLNIAELSALTPPDVERVLLSLDLDPRKARIAQPILRETLSKLSALSAMGLEYLALARDCATLSGGELQRLRLATAMGSPLTGVLYIFDEPSVGLHPDDNAKVLERLAALRDAGNSVIVIEHDIETILSGDHIVEAGPEGGTRGGRIIFNGPTGEFLESPDSVTARAIRESAREPLRSSELVESLQIKRASSNNIRSLDIRIPLGGIVTVAGVSGAGKSSLVHGIVVPLLTEGKVTGGSPKAAQPRRGRGSPQEVERCPTTWKLGEMVAKGSVCIDRVLIVDQQPLSGTSRSTPASYLKIWDEIRMLFAQTIEAKARGWTNSFFSYNTGKGRCPECKGQGTITLEMSFLSEAKVTCETCAGGRYSEEANSVHYLGSSISELLNLTFDEAKVKFAHHRKIHPAVRQACELGLGYLTLGQRSSSLSGGESQRLKLVAELSARRSGHTLYVLDEPTTGLHKTDVQRLLNTLDDLVARGNTVLLIEHDENVMWRSDHIIELGPGPAERGGKILFEGTPAELRGRSTSWGRRLQGNARPRVVGA